METSSTTTPLASVKLLTKSNYFVFDVFTLAIWPLQQRCSMWLTEELLTFTHPAAVPAPNAAVCPIVS